MLQTSVPQQIGANTITKGLRCFSVLGGRFITVKLEEDATPEAVVMELTGMFSRGSELVQ